MVSAPRRLQDATSLLTADVQAALRPLLSLVGAAKEPPTLRAVGELWLPMVRERGRLRPEHPDALLAATVETYEAAWRRIEDLRALDKPAVEETVRWLLERAPKGCRNAFGGALSAALHAAGQGEEMASGRYWRYRPPRNELDLGDLEEAAALASEGLQLALDRGRRPDISVAVAGWLLPFTGARPGEIVSARRSDIREGKLFLQAKRATRWIPLAPAVEEVLRTTAPHKGELLFPGRATTEAGHVGVTALGHALRRWGCPSPIRIRRLYASWLVESGVPITTVAALLGHIDPHTTLRYYARPSARAQVAAVEAVAVALARGQLSFPGMSLGQAAASREEEGEVLAAAPMQKVNIDRAHNNPLGRGRHGGSAVHRAAGGRR